MGNLFLRGKVSLPKDAWLVGGYLVFLFGTVPLMPRLWFRIARGGAWHRFLPEGIGSLLVLSTLRHLFRQRSRHVLLKGFLFVLLALLFFFSMSRLNLPPERIHFSEYGLLAFLLFRLLRHWDGSRRVYAWTLIGACLIGFLDESFQGLLPNRVYDPRDLWLNGFAGAMGLVAVVLLSDPFFVR